MAATAHGLDLLLRVCQTCGEMYGASDGRSKYCGASCSTLAKRGYRNRRQSLYRDSHRAHEQARQMLKNAILLGKIRRPLRCEHCGEVGQTEGHHEDYAKPFYVHWLCRACHAGLDEGQHFVAEAVREHVGHPARSIPMSEGRKQGPVR